MDERVVLSRLFVQRTDLYYNLLRLACMADAVHSQLGLPPGVGEGEQARFNGLKLAPRYVTITVAADGGVGIVPQRYTAEEIKTAESGFRKTATANLVNFVRQRIDTASNQYPPEALVRQVKQHALVVSYLVPLDYGGTLHQRNMMLTPKDQAIAYRSFLDNQLQTAPVSQQHGLPHRQVLALPELADRDETLFMLPRHGRSNLLLPLQHHDPLLLHSKPQRHNWREARAAFQQGAQDTTERNVRRERYATKRALRQFTMRSGTEPR